MTISVQGPPIPANWGKDTLSEFLLAADQNRLATFSQKPQAFAKLAAIDGCFALATKDILNPENEITALLLFRATGYYRSACGAAMAGQVAETFVFTRALLEAAAYAVHVHQNPTAADAWLARHVDADGFKRSRDAFATKTLEKSISRKNPETAAQFMQLYQQAIDHGAHPNQRSLTTTMDMREKANRLEITHTILNGDGVALDFALIGCARAGVVALDILSIPYAEKFEQTGINKVVEAIRCEVMI